MNQTDYSLQNDIEKSNNSNWIYPSFTYKNKENTVTFKREYLLSDIGYKDRGTHFIKYHFDNLFKTIDSELNHNRFVIISLESQPYPKLWHMEVILEKIDDGIYKTLTFYYNTEEYKIYETQNIKERVKQMEGTDIITFKIE